MFAPALLIYIVTSPGVGRIGRPCPPFATLLAQESDLANDNALACCLRRNCNNLCESLP